MKPAGKQASIAVLMGGVNSESQVSMESGERIMAALSTLGYRVVPLVYEGDLATTIPALAGFDLVFIALHGGDGEDGTVQAALEEAGLPYTGSRSAPSRLAMDKQLSKRYMERAGIPTPAWVALDLNPEERRPHWNEFPALAAFLEEHGSPVVVKPNGEGSTVGLSVVESPGDLDQALMLAGEFGPRVLVETYIPGRELTASVLEDVPLPIVEIVPQGGLYDYESKYSDGRSAYFVPADLPLKTAVAIQNAAVMLYRELGCRHYARVDFRLNPQGEYFCLELNTLPGMTSHSLTPMAAAAVEIDFNGLIERIVQAALPGRAPR